MENEYVMRDDRKCKVLSKSPAPNLGRDFYHVTYRDKNNSVRGMTVKVKDILEEN